MYSTSEETEADKELNRALEAARQEKYDEYIEIVIRLALKGHSYAQMHLALAYRKGSDGLEQDTYAALEWHFKAIHPNNPENYFWLFDIFDPSSDQGEVLLFKDKLISNIYYDKAITAFEKKAKKGDLQAMYRLSELYTLNGFTKEKLEKSEYWLSLWKQGREN